MLIRVLLMIRISAMFEARPEAIIRARRSWPGGEMGDSACQ